jgi:hypothetical protein
MIAMGVGVHMFGSLRHDRNADFGTVTVVMVEI